MEEYKESEGQDYSSEKQITSLNEDLYQKLYLENTTNSRALRSGLKIQRSSTFHAKTPRLLEALEYQNIYKESELFVKIKDYIENKIVYEEELIDFLENEVDEKIAKSFPAQIRENLPEIITKIKCLPVLYYLISQNIQYFESSIDDYSIDYTWDLEEIEAKKGLVYETFPLVDPDCIEDFLNGKKTLCASAVVLTINCFSNVIGVIKECLTTLSKIKTSDSIDLRRLIIYAIKLAFCFEFLYSSLKADKESVFFSEGNTEDI